MNRTTLFALSVLTSLAAIAQPTLPVDKPNLKVGDRWVFKTTNLFSNEETSRYEQKITEVKEDEVKLDQTTISSRNAASVGRVLHRKADQSTLTYSNPRIFEGKYVFLAFPLEVGKTWKNEYKWKRTDSGTTSFSSPVKVEGWEEVQVPAGKFKALKVVHSGYYSAQSSGNSWSGSIIETAWYAPEVKRFVKYESIDTPQGDQIRTELIEFEVK